MKAKLIAGGGSIRSGFSGGGSGNSKVMISGTDPLADYLESKLEAGDGITLEAQTGGASDTLKISANILYGTGDPPSAVGLAEGTLYFKYTV